MQTDVVPATGKSKRAKNATKPKAPRAPRKEKGAREPGSRGISAAESARSEVPAAVEALKMLAAAKSFDASKVRADQVARSGGPPPSAEG